MLMVPVLLPIPSWLMGWASLREEGLLFQSRGLIEHVGGEQEACQ